MSTPVISSIHPNTAAQYVSLPLLITGSGFFNGGVSSAISSVTIGGLEAHILSNPNDTQITVAGPVVAKPGVFAVVITNTSGEVSTDNVVFTYTAFNEQQDRSIDYKTAQFWCYGCPFLEIRDSRRPISGENNPVSFDSVEPRYANTTKTHYWCGSPNTNNKQKFYQEMTLIGVGWCPYSEQKWQTLYNVSESF